MKYVKMLATIYNIEPELQYIIEHNESNNLPYHGLRHTIQVTKNVFKICSEIFKDKNTQVIKLMLISALFHDFNHSGGRLSDSLNIEIAIENVKKYCLESGRNINDLPFIEKVIQATQYPYITTNVDIYGNIIRDADLAQSASDDFIYFVLGMQQEFGVKSFKDICKNTIEFNNTNKFILKESEELFSKDRNSNIKLLESYV